MKFFLHKLPEGFIVTSDKKVVGTTGFNGETNEIEFFCSHPKYDEWGLEIIAQQNQIDFSALSEKKQKEIGWFDWKTHIGYLAIEDAKNAAKLNSNWGNSQWSIAFSSGFEQGFQKAQELLSDRKFTLEDMRNCFAVAQNKGAFHMKRQMKTGELTFADFDTYIQSISKNVWEVEIEMEPYTVGEMANLPIGTVNAKPKFINGKIKILKIL